MIRVFIADDHRVLVDGLQTLLLDIEDIQVVGTGHTGLEALAYLQDHEIDVLLLDINMPQLNGIETAKRVSKEFPSVHILALSMYNKASFIQQMLKNGAKGYILKNTGRDQLIEAIRTVASGQQYLGQSVSQTLMNNLLSGQDQSMSFIPEITPREKEVLHLIAKEHTTTEMSAALGISLNTVETHRKNLLSKFGVRNSVGLVRAAMAKGLLD
ncbi:MAG: response regulator transcription factor [Saprospiraceae bacterium]|nr:response regulator transcription factor [Saprospiraceae bacterium]